MPTISGAMIAAGPITMPDCGSSKPRALKAPVTSCTNPRPAAMPITEAISPTRSASRITVASTCRDEAPSVRNIPNSLVRWATVIEKVLKIRKAPTNTEIPAKTRSTVVRNPNPSLMSADCCAASSAPVVASTSAGSSAAMRSASSAGSVPSAACTLIESSSPSLAVIACASVSVKTAIEAPPSGTPEPKRPIPTSSYSFAP